MSGGMNNRHMLVTSQYCVIGIFKTVTIHFENFEFTNSYANNKGLAEGLKMDSFNILYD